jgi:short-subunit dehydrogenase
MLDKICVIGGSSNIIKKYKEKYFDNRIVTVGRSQNDDINLNISIENYEELLEKVPMDCGRYIITLGKLYSKKILDQTKEETLNSIAINLLAPISLIEKIFDINKKARIVILGSESGFKGSYDTTYFLTKAAVSCYVKEKHIKYSEQQLVMIAPSLILDTKMTQDRKDIDSVLKKTKDHPKKRYLYSEEVADLMHYVLFVDKGYINNEIINMNGGKFARMT